mmetsp:Transcript_9200/g.25802  ORF Transcript_9200/g.25802 Transcript_9200/m.25802 type:complete len:233 (-) Transcript_9200:120-818(-)
MRGTTSAFTPREYFARYSPASKRRTFGLCCKPFVSSAHARAPLSCAPSASDVHSSRTSFSGTMYSSPSIPRTHLADFSLSASAKQARTYSCCNNSSLITSEARLTRAPGTTSKRRLHVSNSSSLTLCRSDRSSTHIMSSSIPTSQWYTKEWNSVCSSYLYNTIIHNRTLSRPSAIVSPPTPSRIKKAPTQLTHSFILPLSKPFHSFKSALLTKLSTFPFKILPNRSLCRTDF